MNKDITNHPSALDINEIWTAIEPQVDQINAQRKKRKPVFLYWLSGFGLLIGLVTLGFFLGNPIQNSVTPNQELPKQTSQTAAPIVANELDNTIINEKTNTSILAEVEPTNSVSVNGNEKNSFDSNINIVKKNPIVVSPTSPTVTISNSTSTKNTLSGFPKTTLNSQTLAITQPKKAVSQSSAILGLKSAMTSLAKLPIATVGLKDPETDLPELNFSIKNNKSQLPLPLYVEHPTFSIEFQTGISATNRSLSSTGDSQQ